VRVIPVRAVLVDFDGTACAHDVAEHLLVAFGEGDWPAYDDLWDRGEISGRDAIGAQAAMVRGTTAQLTAFALDHCRKRIATPRCRVEHGHRVEVSVVR